MPRYRMKLQPPSSPPSATIRHHHLCLPPTFLHHHSEYSHVRRLLTESARQGDRAGKGEGREKEVEAAAAAAAGGEGKRTSSCGQNVVPGMLCGWRKEEARHHLAEEHRLKKEKDRKNGDVTERGVGRARFLTPLTFRPRPERYLFRHYEDIKAYCAQYRYHHTVSKAGRASAQPPQEEEMLELEGFRHTRSALASLSYDPSALLTLPTLLLPCWDTNPASPTHHIRPFTCCCSSSSSSTFTACLPRLTNTPSSSHHTSSETPRNDVREMTSRPVTSIFPLSSDPSSRNRVVLTREQFQQLCGCGARWVDQCWMTRCVEDEHDSYQHMPMTLHRGKASCEAGGRDDDGEGTEGKGEDSHVNTDRKERHRTIQREGTDQNDEERHGHGTGRRYGYMNERYGVCDRTISCNNESNVLFTRRGEMHVDEGIGDACGASRAHTRASDGQDRGGSGEDAFGQPFTRVAVPRTRGRGQNGDDTDGHTSIRHRIPPSQSPDMYDRDATGSGDNRVTSPGYSDGDMGHMCQWEYSEAGVIRFLPVISHSSRNGVTTVRYVPDPQLQGEADVVSNVWSKENTAVDSASGMQNESMASESQLSHCHEPQPHRFVVKKTRSDKTRRNQTTTDSVDMNTRKDGVSVNNAHAVEKQKNAACHAAADANRENVELKKLRISWNDASVDPIKHTEHDEESDSSTEEEEEEEEEKEEEEEETFCRESLNFQAGTEQMTEWAGKVSDLNRTKVQPPAEKVSVKRTVGQSVSSSPLSSPHRASQLTNTAYHSLFEDDAPNTTITTVTATTTTIQSWHVFQCQHRQCCPRVPLKRTVDSPSTRTSLAKSGNRTHTASRTTRSGHVTHTKIRGRKLSVQPTGKRTRKQVKTEPAVNYDDDSFTVLDSIVVKSQALDHRDAMKQGQKGMVTQRHKATVTQCAPVAADDGAELHHQAGSAFLTHPTLLLRLKNKQVPQFSSSSSKTLGTSTVREPQLHWRLPRIGRNSANCETDDQPGLPPESSNSLKRMTGTGNCLTPPPDRQGSEYHLVSATAWNNARKLQAAERGAGLANRESSHPVVKQALNKDSTNKGLHDIKHAGPPEENPSKYLLHKHPAGIMNSTSSDKRSANLTSVTPSGMANERGPTLANGDHINSKVSHVFSVQSNTCPSRRLCVDGIGHEPAGCGQCSVTDGLDACELSSYNRHNRARTVSESAGSAPISTERASCHPHTSDVTTSTGDRSRTCLCHHANAGTSLTSGSFHVPSEARIDSRWCAKANNPACERCFRVDGMCDHNKRDTSVCDSGDLTKRTLRGLVSSEPLTVDAHVEEVSSKENNGGSTAYLMSQTRSVHLSNWASSVNTTLPCIKGPSETKDSLCEKDSQQNQPKMRYWREGSPSIKADATTLVSKRKIFQARNTTDPNTSKLWCRNQAKDKRRPATVLKNEYPFPRCSENEVISTMSRTPKSDNTWEVAQLAEERAGKNTRGKPVNRKPIQQDTHKNTFPYSRERVEQTAASNMEEDTALEAIRAPPNSPSLDMRLDQREIPGSQRLAENKERIGSAVPFQLAKIGFRDNPRSAFWKGERVETRPVVSKCWGPGRMAAQTAHPTSHTSVQRKREIHLRLRSSLSRPSTVSTVPSLAGRVSDWPRSVSDLRDVIGTPTRWSTRNDVASAAGRSAVQLDVHSVHARRHSTEKNAAHARPATHGPFFGGRVHGEHKTVAADRQATGASVHTAKATNTAMRRRSSCYGMMLHEVFPEPASLLSISGKMTLCPPHNSTNSAELVEERTPCVPEKKTATSVLSKADPTPGSVWSSSRALPRQKRKQVTVDHRRHGTDQGQSSHHGHKQHGQHIGGYDLKTGVGHSQTVPLERIQYGWNFNRNNTTPHNNCQRLWEQSSGSDIISGSQTVPDGNSSCDWQHNMCSSEEKDTPDGAEQLIYSGTRSPVDQQISQLKADQSGCQLKGADTHLIKDRHFEIDSTDRITRCELGAGDAGCRSDCLLDDTDMGGDVRGNAGDGGPLAVTRRPDHFAAHADDSEEDASAFGSSLTNYTFGSLFQLSGMTQTSDSLYEDDSFVSRSKLYGLVSQKQNDTKDQSLRGQPPPSQDRTGLSVQDKLKTQDKQGGSKQDAPQLMKAESLEFGLQGEMAIRHCYQTLTNIAKAAPLQPGHTTELSSELIQRKHTTPQFTDHRHHGSQMPWKPAATAQLDSKMGQCISANSQRKMAGKATRSRNCSRRQELMAQARRQKNDKRHVTKREKSSNEGERTGPRPHTENVKRQWVKTGHGGHRQELGTSHQPQGHQEPDQAEVTYKTPGPNNLELHLHLHSSADFTKPEKTQKDNRYHPHNNRNSIEGLPVIIHRSEQMVTVNGHNAPGHNRKDAEYHWRPKERVTERDVTKASPFLPQKTGCQSHPNDGIQLTSSTAGLPCFEAGSSSREWGEEICEQPRSTCVQLEVSALRTGSADSWLALHSRGLPQDKQCTDNSVWGRATEP